MPDVDPNVLRRMLLLRQFPIFGAVDLPALATVSENLIEAVFAPGAVIVPVDARAASIHLIVDGGVVSHARGAAPHRWGPRDVLCELEVLAGRRPAAAVIATSETRTLQLSAADLGELLEDDFGLLRAALHHLASRMPAGPAAPRRHAAGVPRTEPFGLVERLILLRQQVPFVRGHVQALAMVAHASEEVTWPAGTVLARAGDLADQAIFVIDGALAARRDDGDTRMLGAGDAVGVVETLAGLAHTRTVEAVTQARGLRTSATAIFDALEDHTDFGLAIIGAFAGAILDHGAERDREVPATVN